MGQGFPKKPKVMAGTAEVGLGGTGAGPFGEVGQEKARRGQKKFRTRQEREGHQGAGSVRKYGSGWCLR